MTCLQLRARPWVRVSSVILTNRSTAVASCNWSCRHKHTHTHSIQHTQSYHSICRMVRRVIKRINFSSSGVYISCRKEGKGGKRVSEWCCEEDNPCVRFILFSCPSTSSSPSPSSWAFGKKNGPTKGAGEEDAIEPAAGEMSLVKQEKEKWPALCLT